MIKSFSLTLLPLIVFVNSLAQHSDSVKSEDQINRKRFNSLIVGSAAGYSAGMFGLYHLWYKNTERQSFTFFNDNAEWKQMDKGGHFLSSFFLSYGAQKALRWTGVQKGKADLYGALAGFAVLVPIEVFDGYSASYGASTGDLIADAGGALFFLGQQMLWDDIFIHPKFSFHRTRYAAKRPDVLGDGLISEILKDYNGETFWLSVDMDRFTPFPKWLNLAVGYGAEGMVYGRDSENRFHNYSSYRQFYFSIDFDVKSIKTRSKPLKALLFFANMIKIPAPAIEFSNRPAKFHALYF